ncbi:hypothetical protein KQX54_008979 [Cotesia glomerata]|uniref:Uncharacterized protein n=1 Tax=Cotesia glomerata TaxID=32391 RepID=A0AAV7HZF7_COTGL|nr:hypothetical protein KQX54_008979 [Cotesia glomerata]
MRIEIKLILLKDFGKRLPWKYRRHSTTRIVFEIQHSVDAINRNENSFSRKLPKVRVTPNVSHRCYLPSNDFAFSIKRAGDWVVEIRVERQSTIFDREVDRRPRRSGYRCAIETTEY